MPGSVVDQFTPLSYGIREYRCPTQELHDPISQFASYTDGVVCRRCLKRLVLDYPRKRFYHVDFHIVEVEF